MTYVVGQDVGDKLIAALGLGNVSVRCIDLHVGVDEVVTAKVEMMVTDTASGNVVRLMEDYLLVRRENKPPTQDIPC